ARITYDTCRDPLVLHPALKINPLPPLFFLAPRHNVPPPGTADTFRKPASCVRWRHQRCLRVRNIGRTTCCGKAKRVLDARDGFRAVAEKRPAPADISQQIRTILETTSADNAGAMPTHRPSLHS